MRMGIGMGLSRRESGGRRGNFDYEVNQFPVYGQSLSVGQAKPAISASNYDNLMFTKGMRPQYDYPLGSAATWYADFVDAVEEDSPENANLAETPCSGAGDMVKQLIEEENGLTPSSHTYKLLLSAPGYGATQISQLDTGSTHYDRLVEQATYGASVAATNNLTYGLQAVGWVQGESDYLNGTTQATYESLFNSLVSDYATSTGAAPIWIIAQTASHIHYAGDNYPDIALAQLAVAASNAKVYCAGGMYHLPYDDGGHLTGIGSKILGAYLGLVYKRVVIDGEDWQPLAPTATSIDGTTCDVTFSVPSGSLTWDTTTVPAQTSYGFELYESDGTTPITINSVTITGTDAIQITAAASIPSGAILRYAHQGNSKVGLGNLRDTQGNSLVFDPYVICARLHNWCAIFEETL